MRKIGGGRNGGCGFEKMVLWCECLFLDDFLAVNDIKGLKCVLI